VSPGPKKTGLIIPAGTYNEAEQDMFGRIAALSNAVKRHDVLEMAILARLKAAEDAPAGAEPIVTSGTCMPDTLYLFALALFDKAPKCCEHITCPRHRAHDTARELIMKLAGVGDTPDGQPLQHNVVPLTPPQLVKERPN
jgi:hypothetical protein